MRARTALPHCTVTHGEHSCNLPFSCTRCPVQASGLSVSTAGSFIQQRQNASGAGSGGGGDPSQGGAYAAPGAPLPPPAVTQLQGALSGAANPQQYSEDVLHMMYTPNNAAGPGGGLESSSTPPESHLVNRGSMLGSFTEMHPPLHFSW